MAKVRRQEKIGQRHEQDTYILKSFKKKKIYSVFFFPILTRILFTGVHYIGFYKSSTITALEAVTERKHDETVLMLREL